MHINIDMYVYTQHMPVHTCVPIFRSSATMQYLRSARYPEIYQESTQKSYAFLQSRVPTNGDRPSKYPVISDIGQRNIWKTKIREGRR